MFLFFILKVLKFCITKFCKFILSFSFYRLAPPASAIKKDRGQDYLDMRGLTLVNLETFNVSSVEDFPPPPTPPKRE